MAEGMAFDLVTGVLGKLGSALWDEIGLLRSFKDDADDLKSNFLEIKAVLLDAEERSSVEIEETRALRIWLRELKAAAYDIDDLLDEIRTEALLRKQQRELQNQNQLAKIVCDQFLSRANPINVNFKSKMKVLREKIDKIAKQRHVFGLVEADPRRQAEFRRPETTSLPVVDEMEIVGRHDDKEEIVELLLETNGDHDVSVIPIVGLGGLGKTTLAQLAFNDRRVKGEQRFDLRVWVCVSTDFNMKKIAEAVKFRTRGKGDLTTEESPESFLRNTFSQNKVLLVLDDVWNEDPDKWEELKVLFKDGKKGSKILVTTRNERVAKIMKTAEPLRVEGLSGDDCWTLFKRRAFEEGEENGYPSLVEIGKQVVNECGGVPLAANALGGMMRFKSRTEDAWSAIRDSEIWRLKEEEDILPPLKLSYIQMPSALKQCFAYCSIFPKDYEIDKDDLIRQWIALGFISSPDTSTSMEDIGNEYFNDLLWMSFLQDVKKHWKSEKVTYRMHDLVHDLAQSVAREEVAVRVGEYQTSIPEGCRYASIHSRFMPKVPTTIVQRLRALRFRKSASLMTFYSGAKCLRLLDFQDSNISVLPSSIGKLKLLRYLNLSGTNIKELPESITSLCNLQTLNLSFCQEIHTLPKSLGSLVNLEKLDITSCKNLCELPKMIQKLANLRKLLNKYCWKLKGMPRGIGELFRLQELPIFVIGKQDHVEHCASISELEHLKLVDELEIKGLENVTNPDDAKKANLKEKNLRSLKLKWNVLSAAEDLDTVQLQLLEGIVENLQPHQNLENLKIEGYGGRRFPSWMMSSTDPCLPNLKKIKLINIPKCSSLPPLGQLPFLKVLYIWNVPQLTNINAIAKMLPALTTLLLGCMPMLQEWKTVDGEEGGRERVLIFPCLTQLTLYNCPQLRPEPCLPASVENLIISRTSKENLSLILERATMMDSETRPNDGAGAVSHQLPNKGLRELTIGDCLQVTCLPESLRSLTSLQSLTISGCEDLERIDDWLGDLTELQSLYIEWCQRLSYLPTLNMNVLPHIHSCPLLPKAEPLLPKAEPLLPADPFEYVRREWIAFDLVTGVLGKLGSALWDEIGLLRSFKDDADDLRSNFSAIQAVLLDAEERSSVEIESYALCDWLGKLKDAAYDADDLLDEIRTEALLRKQQRELQNQNQPAEKVRGFLSHANPMHLKFKLKMAHRMKELREKIGKIAKQRHDFGLVEAGPRRQAEFKRPETTISVVDEEKIVGRDDDKEEIVKLLLETNGDHDVSVIPIVGLGGLGKTTLAQLAFNDKRVKGEQRFDLRVWVCVSTDFNMKTIAKPVISAARENCDDLDNLDAVATCLVRIFSQKRFFLVLDDVWNEEQDKWENLKVIFKDAKKGSKILVTTRSEKVAMIMKTVEQPHRVKGLSDDDCWKLFKRRAFEEGEENDYPHLVEIGKQIVNKCGGLPLAVNALGSMMRFKNRTEDAWLAIRNNEIWTLKEEKTILPSLKLSYIQMPSALKQCFAYCSIFPKDYEIDKDDLIWHWIALGFISSLDTSTSMEDIGNEYFNDLLWMSFLQDVKKHWKSEKVTCRMHDLVHDLAQSVAREEVAVILGKESTWIPEGCRYASIYSYSMPQVPTTVVQRLRALRFRESALPMTFYSGAKCLRLLDFQDSNISVLPSSIGKLKLLRYLNLSGTNIQELPESITYLCNLQSLNLSNCREICTLPKSLGSLVNLEKLDITSCKNLCELPKMIQKLTKLRELLNKDCLELKAMPRGIGKLVSLRELPIFVIGKQYRVDHCASISELEHLKLVGELEIKGLENVTNPVDAKAANLIEKNLRSLKLKWNVLSAAEDMDTVQPAEEMDAAVLENLRPHQNLANLVIEGYAGRKFPSWMMNKISRHLPNLVEIKLMNMPRCSSLPPLGQLPSLKTLKIQNMPAITNLGVEFYGDSHINASVKLFPELTTLELLDMPVLGEWVMMVLTVDEGRRERVPIFPCLTHLRLDNCPQLRPKPCLPASVEYLAIFRTSNENLSLILEHATMDSEIPLDDGDGAISLQPPNKGLRELDITNCQQVICLPKSLQSLTSLQKLRISGCEDLKRIEDWLGELTDLQSLIIYNCNSLQYLPAHKMTTLKELSIEDCPLLFNEDGQFADTSVDHINEVYVNSRNYKDKKQMSSSRQEEEIAPEGGGEVSSSRRVGRDVGGDRIG